MLYYNFFSQKSQVIRTVFSIFRPAAITETNYYTTSKRSKKFFINEKLLIHTLIPISSFHKITTKLYFSP